MKAFLSFVVFPEFQDLKVERRLTARGPCGRETVFPTVELPLPGLDAGPDGLVEQACDVVRKTVAAAAEMYDPVHADGGGI